MHNRLALYHFLGRPRRAERRRRRLAGAAAATRRLGRVVRHDVQRLECLEQVVEERATALLERREVWLLRSSRIADVKLAQV